MIYTSVLEWQEGSWCEEAVLKVTRRQMLYILKRRKSDAGQLKNANNVPLTKESQYFSL